MPLTLTATDRQSLEALCRKRSLPHYLVQRARMVLLASQGYPHTVIAAKVGCGRQHVAHWLRQWNDAGVDGITDGLGLTALLRRQRPCQRPSTPKALRETIHTTLRRLRSAPRALHYRELAARVHEPDVLHVNRQCIALTKAGRLRWVDFGTYALRETQ